MPSIEELLEYDLWATRLTLDSLKDLSEQEFAAQPAGDLSSIRQQSVHLVSVVDRYRARLMGETPPEVSFESFTRPIEVISYSQEVALRMQQLIAYLPHLSMDEELRMETRRGVFVATIAEVMQHMVNHSTYHRGQIAAMMKHLGREPVDTDLVIWVKNRQRS